MRPQGMETSYSYSSMNKAVILSTLPFTALNGSIHVSMVFLFTELHQRAKVSIQQDWYNICWWKEDSCSMLVAPRKM